jgi:hypothetical protein
LFGGPQGMETSPQRLFGGPNGPENKP